jgi:hypothetical protein
MSTEIKALIAAKEIPNNLTVGKLYPVIRYIHPSVFVISDCGVEVMLGLSRFESGWKVWDGPLPEYVSMPSKRSAKPSKPKRVVVKKSPIRSLFEEISNTNEIDLPPLFRQILLAHIEENYFPKEKKFACEVYRLGLTNAISGEGKENLDVENLLTERYGV